MIEHYNDIPWPHLIIDDFLTAEDFDVLQNYVVSRYDVDNIKTAVLENHTKQGQSDIYKLLSPYVDMVRERYLKQLNYGNKPIPSEMKSLIELRICPPGFVYKKIHCDTPEKIMSTVLYVTPAKSTGTELYTTKQAESYYSTVEWQQNRALVFVGQNNPAIQGTWHNYRNNTKTARVTANLILQLVKP